MTCPRSPLVPTVIQNDESLTSKPSSFLLPHHSGNPEARPGQARPGASLKHCSGFRREPAASVETSQCTCVYAWEMTHWSPATLASRGHMHISCVSAGASGLMSWQGRSRKTARDRKPPRSVLQDKEASPWVHRTELCHPWASVLSSVKWGCKSDSISATQCVVPLLTASAPPGKLQDSL